MALLARRRHVQEDVVHARHLVDGRRLGVRRGSPSQRSNPPTDGKTLIMMESLKSLEEMYKLTLGSNPRGPTRATLFPPCCCPRVWVYYFAMWERCVLRTFWFESCFWGRFTTKFSVWGCLLARYYGGSRDSCSCRVPVPLYYCAVVPVLQYH